MGSLFSRPAQIGDEEVQVNISRYPQPSNTEYRMSISPNVRMIDSRSFIPPTMMEGFGTNYSPQSNVESLPSTSQTYRREFNDRGQMMKKNNEEDSYNREKTQSSRKRRPGKTEDDDEMMRSRFLRSHRKKMPLVLSKSVKFYSLPDSKESEANTSKESLVKMKKFRFSHLRPEKMTSFTGRKRKTYEGIYGNVTTGMKIPRRQ